MSKINVHKIDVLSGHKGSIFTLEFSPQAHTFFSSGEDGFVAAWNLDNPEIGELMLKVPRSIYAMRCIQEDNVLLVGQNFEGIHEIDLENKEEKRSVKITSNYIFDIQVWEEEIFVATGDGVIIVLDKASLQVKKHLKASDKSVRCLAVSPLRSELAAGYSDHGIRIFDLKTKELKHTIKAHKSSVFTLQYSPSESFLLSGSRDAHLKVWSCEEAYPLHQSVVAHMYAINHLTYSPDQQYFATASMDKSIKIWDSQSLQLLKVIDKARHAGHGNSVNRLLWTAYQNRLISASDDRLISIWDIQIN